MTTHRLAAPHLRALVATLVALLVTAGCASSSGTEGSGATADAATSEATPASETPSSEGSPELETTPIDGIWSTPTLRPDSFRQTLTRQGLGVHADAFLAGLPTKVDMTLEIGAGYWTLTTGPAGEALTVTDRGTYQLEGGRVRVRPLSGGENVFRWRVDDDQLQLALVSTTEPPYQGVPAETYQRGFYTTSAFAEGAP